MKKASWIVLLALGLAMLALSLVSAVTAYTRNWAVGPTTLAKIEAATPGAGVALRGSRATAAAFAVGYWVLFLTIVLGPYRRGEVWAWWALLGSTLSLAAIILLRVPLLGTTVGAITAIAPLAVVLLSLLPDLGRVRGSGRRGASPK